MHPTACVERHVLVTCRREESARREGSVSLAIGGRWISARPESVLIRGSPVGTYERPAPSRYQAVSQLDRRHFCSMARSRSAPVASRVLSGMPKVYTQ